MTAGLYPTPTPGPSELLTVSNHSSPFTLQSHCDSFWLHCLSFYFYVLFSPGFPKQTYIFFPLWSLYYFCGKSSILIFSLVRHLRHCYVSLPIQVLLIYDLTVPGTWQTHLHVSNHIYNCIYFVVVVFFFLPVYNLGLNTDFSPRSKSSTANNYT